ncbi:DNA-binding CsgD family transcriptional regulator [Rhizomicrobium palustre]|uniref:DNA-binding CsgD family transcriptional regulator n=1 Tax=Rhizomicrobium palustre TaxID=189966 RepID=A0A846MV33_9PROT|nr:response regulator transcription factor [Rhizomicrobium palustre]NIK87089.1 DNA-binding CsgD family transcriptional regulator [Rhizomicrobium palustre]
MWRSILAYGVALAAAAFLLDWLELKFAMRLLSPSLYAFVIALLFAGLGIWTGYALTLRKVMPIFERNNAAIASLGLSPREIGILELLAAGKSNKEIAQSLAISPNTVKTHVANLYAKLDAGRRTEAIHKARELAILP